MDGLVRNGSCLNASSHFLWMFSPLYFLWPLCRVSICPYSIYLHLFQTLSFNYLRCIENTNMNRVSTYQPSWSLWSRQWDTWWNEYRSAAWLSTQQVVHICTYTEENPAPTTRSAHTQCSLHSDWVNETASARAVQLSFINTLVRATIWWKVEKNCTELYFSISHQ